MELLRGDIGRLTRRVDGLATAVNRAVADGMAARANIEIQANRVWARVAWGIVGALGTGFAALAGLYSKSMRWY